MKQLGGDVANGALPFERASRRLTYRLISATLRSERYTVTVVINETAH